MALTVEEQARALRERRGTPRRDVRGRVERVVPLDDFGGGVELALRGFPRIDESQVPPGALSYGFVPQSVQESNRRAGRTDAEYVTFTTNGANDVRVEHDLRRPPRRFAVVWKSAAVDVFPGTSAWNATTVFFQASASGQTVTVELA